MLSQTSGTMHPIANIGRELGVKFEHVFVASHMVPRDNIWIGTIARTGTHEEFDGTVIGQNTSNYLEHLGMALIEISKVTPNGSYLYSPRLARTYS